MCAIGMMQAHRGLDPVIRRPSALPLDRFEMKLNEFLGQFCHRRLGAGWKMDKTVRDSGPFLAKQEIAGWSGVEKGTHQPMLIWYSPEMITWIRANRPAHPATLPTSPPPVPDGAIIVKEMYGNPPASNCRVADLLRLKPVKLGATVMIRDRAASKDGWTGQRNREIRQLLWASGNTALTATHRRATIRPSQASATSKVNLVPSSAS
jgi:hypothetical protein